MITFPSMNLQFNISPIAIRIGCIDIYWYAIIIVLAIVMAVLNLKISENKAKISFETMIDLIIYLIPVSIISARLYYVVFNLGIYIKEPWQILNIRTGGLAIYGAVIGGTITCYIFCKKRNIEFLELLDYLAPSLALGQAIGRWGNFVNVEAYGTKTNNFFRMGIVENGNYVEVHPTFLYESISTFIIFLILLFLSKKKKFSGEIVYAYFILYAFVRFFIEGVRIDSLMFYQFRISQILSLVFFVMFSGIMSYKLVKRRKA